MAELEIRAYTEGDADEVVSLWSECGLIRSWNDPRRDIARKLDDSPGLLFVGESGGRLVSTCMAGYDGHRGWIYYLAVKPSMQGRGFGRAMMRHAEKRLHALGCPKIDLMVREDNEGVIEFYRRIGYGRDPVAVLSRRMTED